MAHTHGLAGSRDLKIADRISEAMKLRRDRLEFDTPSLNALPSMWREFVTMTEGLYPLSQMHALLILKHLAGRFDVLIDSYGGALYRRQIKKFIEPRINPKLDIAEQVLPYELTALVLSPLLKKEVQNELKEASRRALRDYYDTTQDIANIGDKFDLYYADQTAALRDSISANLQMNFLTVRQPLMNQKALDAVRRLPSSLRRKEGIHKYIIGHCYSKLEHFSVDYSGYPAPYRGFSALRLVAPAAERVIGFGDRFIPSLKRVSLRRPPMDVKNILVPGMSLMKELLLTPHPLYDSLIERGTLERAIKDISGGDFGFAPAILQLLTFRLFLDIFF